MKIAEREIAFLRQMKGHPNIINLIEDFVHNEKVFMVFELMSQNLLDVLQNSPDSKLGHEQVRLIVY